MNKRTRSNFALAGIAVLSALVIFSAHASAADGNAAEAGVPTGANTEELNTKPFAHYQFTYWGAYQGPALAHPTSSGSIDTTSLDYTGGEQNILNQLKLDVNLTENIYVGPVLNMTVNLTGGQAFNMYDSGVRVGNRKLVHTDNFNLSADFRAMAPLRASYRAAGEVFDAQSLEILNYDVPHTKFSLGILAFSQFQFYGSGIPSRDPLNPATPKDYSLYFAPNVSYQMTKTVALTLYYETYPWHKFGGSLTDFSSDPSDIAPGISWDITKDVNFSPQILLYPSRLGWNTLGTIAYLSAKLL